MESQSLHIEENAAIVTELAHRAGHDGVTYVAEYGKGFWTISVEYADGGSKPLWVDLTDGEAYMLLTGINYTLSNYMIEQQPIR